MPQIPSGFGQNRGILYFAEDNSSTIKNCTFKVVSGNPIYGIRDDASVTGKVRAEALHPPTNFLMRLSVGLEIQIHGSEQRGRRAKG
jgi:hypothetical protein